MPAPQLREGLLCSEFLLFSIGLDSPMIGNSHGEREQDEAENACEKVHTIKQERKIQRKQLNWVLSQGGDMSSFACA